jgi:outer membrane protein OmpA-like peptidoglycan-associated protein
VVANAKRTARDGVSSREDAKFMIVSSPSRGFGAAALAVGLVLAGCSSDSDVPPTEVSAPGGGTQMNTDTGSGGTFPDINTVPNQRPTSTIQDLAQAPDGLGAARSGTQYGEALVGGPTSFAPPPPPPAPPQDALAPIPEPGLQTQSPAPEPVQAAPVQTPAAPSEPIAVPEIAEPAPMEPVAPSEPEPAPAAVGEGQTIQGTTAEPAPQAAAQPEPAPAAPEESAPATAPQPEEQPTQPADSANDPSAYGIAAPQSAPSPYDAAPEVAAASPGVPAAAPSVPADAQPIGMIYFREGSSSLSSDDVEVVRQIAEMQRAYGGVVSVVGHANTASSSPDEADGQIAEARANAVAQELVRYGVPQSAIRTSGAGASQPLRSDAMPGSAAANRRAEVYLTAN